ncbi:rod shape-determining protein RodA [Chondromyces apiculatus]|uniref:Cell wall polymerase n=1 Tax=Chondromyces apiculatus DSM 436 TaxID=1192034 RepID=A0A017SZ95_9BACT|nr:rod shape-determining protein RodA [Chondromyces apiculatus]EYF02052.1 Rod shape-determining protein RodA [Chondromyces apiculatus DSM 436]
MIRDGLAGHERDHFDWPLFIGAVLIGVLGVINLYSATSVYSGARAELYISQVYWLFVGGILGGILVAIDYRHLERLGYILYTFGVFSLALVFVLAKDVRGSARWIEFGSFRFQPSEFMKVFLVIALAKYLHDDPRNEGRTLRDLAIPAALTGVPALLVLKQPDLGTASILTLVFLTIAAMTRLRWKSIALFLGTVVAAAPIVWTYVLLPYQRDRVTVFLNPEGDLLRRGWHAYNSRVAIGDGGVFGSGYLKGTQNQFLFLPDQYTDFPFPVFAEEWGFAGTVLLVSIYAFLSLWGIRIASQAKDRFGAVLGVGCSAILFWHALINMGMTSGVLPVVGVTLPLFSYGGSSVTTVMVALALLMSVSVRRYSGVPSLDRL